MFCTACATLNAPAARHCAGCRRPLAAGPEAARTRRRHRLRSAPILVLLPLLALAVAGGVWWRLAEVERRAWYERGRAAEAAGDYPAAMDAYAAAAGRDDAARRVAAIAAALPAAERAHAAGLDALAAGDTRSALVDFGASQRRLPGFRDGAALLRSTRSDLERELRATVARAEAAGDWLAAEQALRELILLQPGDAASRQRLATIRAERAPFVLARDRELWLVGPDGADQRRIAAAVPATRPVWSPDRTRIAFVSGDLDRPDAPASLYVAAADGSETRRVATMVHPNALPSWNPDGVRLAFTSVADWSLREDRGLLAIHVVDVETGEERNVTAQTGKHAVTPNWSPDGRTLAFVGRARDPSAGADGLDGPADLYALDVDSGAVRDLTRGRLPGLLRALWSPNGDRLLLFARTGAARAINVGDGGSGLYVLSPADGALATVAARVDTTATAWAPAWSPDGRAFAYVDGIGTIVVVDDRETTRVETETFLSGAVSWAPAGGALLAAAADPRDGSILLRLAGPTPALETVALDYDTIWPAGTPQWGSPLGLVADSALGRFGSALDARSPLDPAPATGA